MEQFTANEVVTKLRERFTSGNDVPVPDVRLTRAEFDAFADLLEAREKAVPVAWRTFDGEGNYDYRDYENNEHYRDWYVSRNGAKYANWVEPLYSHPAPADTERLAEALRCALTWIEVAPHADSCGDADAYNHTELRSCGCGKDAIVENLAEALAAHSAQAQPPAASATDAIARRMVAEYDAVLCGDPTATRTDGMRAALEAVWPKQPNAGNQR